MSEMSVEILGLAIAVLIGLRVPIAFAILGPCLAYMWSHDQSVGFAMRTATGGVNSWPLLAVPLFILVGFLATRAGIAERVFALVLALFGRFRGALGYVNIGVSLGFSWMNGSALADAAGVGSIEIPHMVKKGYPRRFAVGLTAASSVIGPIMPPSIPAVVFASVALVSTSALFAASVLPALLICVTLAIYVFFWARRHDDIPSEPFSWREVTSHRGRRPRRPLRPRDHPRAASSRGYFTPTEAAAVEPSTCSSSGSSTARSGLRDLPKVFADTATTTAAIMVILGASSLLGWILARERVPQAIAETFLGFTDNKIVFLHHRQRPPAPARGDHRADVGAGDQRPGAPAGRHAAGRRPRPLRCHRRPQPDDRTDDPADRWSPLRAELGDPAPLSPRCSEESPPSWCRSWSPCS